MMSGTFSDSGGRWARGRDWLQWLAAPRLTVIFFLLTALSLLAVIILELPATALMIAPFGLLLVNLGAAIAAIPRFRRDVPLLIFHLALLGMVMLLILSRLTFFHGWGNLAQGETFRGRLAASEGGPFHEQALRELRFTNLGFREAYPGEGPFRYTYNRVHFTTPDGDAHVSVIGDDTPLVISGYRIYTAPTRGYAPLFEWRAKDGKVTQGRVQLDNPVSGERPAVSTWQLPDGTEVWTMLDQGGSTPLAFAPSATPVERVNLGANTLPHRLVVRVGDAERVELQPGESWQRPDGTLTYLQLNAWMGYRIIYDPMRPWLVGTVVVGVLSLLWFYLRHVLRGRSWDSDR